MSESFGIAAECPTLYAGVVAHLMDLTRGVLVAPNVVKAETFRTRLVGLLGHRSLPEDEGLWIEPCDSIHTFFMRFPIDVAFVDRKGVVIRRIDAIKPWRGTRLHSKAVACVELAAGVLARTGVVEGARLALVPPPKS
jgi:hypothetical protein